MSLHQLYVFPHHLHFLVWIQEVPPTRPDHDIHRDFNILLHHLQQTCGNATMKTWFFIMSCLISAFESFLMSINICSPRLGVRPPSVRLEHSSSLPAPVRTGNDQTSPIYAKCSMRNRTTSNLLLWNCLFSNVLESIPVHGQTPVVPIQTSTFGIDSRLHGVHTHLY